MRSDELADRLQEEVARLTAERDRLREEVADWDRVDELRHRIHTTIVTELDKSTSDLVRKRNQLIEERDEARAERDTLAAQLARAETVIEAAAAYVAEFRWMLNVLVEIENPGHDNAVRVALARAVDAYQATPAPTEREGAGDAPTTG